jgi:hypothetical protein
MRTLPLCMKWDPCLILEVIATSMLSLFCRTIKSYEVVSDGMIFVQNFAEKSKVCLKILLDIEAVTRTRTLPHIAP